MKNALPRLFLFLALLQGTTYALAQEEADTKAAETKPDIQSMLPQPTPFKRFSLMFTAEEYNALDHILSRLRPQTENTAQEDNNLVFDIGEDTTEPNAPVGPRTIHLGGMVYFTPDNWTIWLNGEQIVPGKLPRQIRAIRVGKREVSMFWQVNRAGKTILVTLQPNQVYSVDTGEITSGDSFFGKKGEAAPPPKENSTTDEQAQQSTSALQNLPAARQKTTDPEPVIGPPAPTEGIPPQ